MRGSRNTEPRFWGHVDKSAGPYACWPWTSTVRHSNSKDQRGYEQMKDAQDRNYKLADNTAKSQFGSDPAQAEAYGSEMKSLMDTMDFGGKSLHELNTHDRGIAMGQIQQQAMFNLEDRKHGQPGSSTGVGTTSKAGVGSLAWQSIKDGSPSEFGKGIWYGATKNKNGSVVTNDRIPTIEADAAVDSRGRKKKEQ